VWLGHGTRIKYITVVVVDVFDVVVDVVVVGSTLMPCNDTPTSWGFHKQLIVPEANGSIVKKLRGRN
jgi:hypothetical protein